MKNSTAHASPADEQRVTLGLAQLSAAFNRGFARRRFRGTLIDNCRTAPMGKGHGNDGRPFDIETACYMKPWVEAYHRHGTRKIVIKAGVKTLKSFFGEMAAGYAVCHGLGDVTIFFGSGEMADDVSTTRIMAFMWGIPSFAEKMKTITDRFDETNSAVKFPDKTFFLKPANLANTQQKNLEFVLVQDAFVTGVSGMIDQAIERTTQYAHSKKIVLESQGGEKGFDFDRHYEDTDQGELHVNCPCCGRSHIFNWKVYDEASMTRPADFKATLPKARIEEIVRKFVGDEVTSLKLNPDAEKLETPHVVSYKSQLRNPFSAINHAIGFEIAFAELELTETLLAQHRRVAGFKRGNEELIKQADGSYNETEILLHTYFECFHCGGHWQDDGEFGATRIALDRSSHYISARKDALPENVGFNCPQWINRRLPWGKIMLEKLKRQKVATETGNFEPLKQWWQKFAARTWDPDQDKKERQLEIAVGSHETDPAKLVPNFHSRDMLVDSQKDKDAGPNEDKVGTFWYVVREFDKAGNSLQRARGFAESWEQLLAVQKFWKVPNQRFCIDASKWGPQIEMMAAMNFEMVTPLTPHPLTGRKDPYPSCWRLFYGDKRAEFKIDGKPSAVSEGQPSRYYTADRNGMKHVFRIFKYRWSNLAFEMQLDAILSRTPGMARFESLPRNGLFLPNGQPDAITLAKETGILTYDQQMGARYMTKVRGVNKFEDIKGREAHYRDCELMGLVRASQDGLLGHVAPVAVEETE